MAIPSRSFSAVSAAQAKPLCPNCGAGSVHIVAAVAVHYEVMWEPAAQDIEVVGELFFDSAWDDATEARCPRCDWRGNVADLRRNLATQP